jgi:hypothetical protein
LDHHRRGATVDGSSTEDSTPDLDWSSVTGATSYRLQVDDDPAITSPEIDTATSGSDSTPTSPLSLGWYYWRVRGSNGCGDGFWSTVFSYWVVTKAYLPVVMRN